MNEQASGSMYLNRPAATIATPPPTLASHITREHYQLLFPLDNPALEPVAADWSDAEWL